MLSLFKPNRPSSEPGDDFSSSSDEEHVLPPGTPYLTKINGKLVWARKKVPKTINPVQDLMGEAFGGNTTMIVRRPSRSPERQVTRAILRANSAAQSQQSTHSAPVQQQAFPNATASMAHCPYHPPFWTPQYPAQWSPQFPPQFQPHPMPQPGPFPVPFAQQHPQQHPQQYPQQHPPQFGPQGLRLYVPQHSPVPPQLFVQQSPTEKEKEQLHAIDKHFNQAVKPSFPKVTSASSDESQDKQRDKAQGKASEIVVNLTAEMNSVKVKNVVAKHICGDCGRLRSRKYHHEHPLKPGKVPEVAFCRKCQKNATSTSDSSDTEIARAKGKKEKKDKKGKEGKEGKKAKSSSGGYDPPLEHPAAGPTKSPEPDLPKLSLLNQPTTEQVPAEEYIIVEEEFSDHEPQSRGISKKSAPTDYEARRRPLSPMSSQLSVIRSKPDSHVRPARKAEVVYEKPERSRQYQKSDRAHGRTSPYQAYSEEVPERTASSHHVRDRAFEQDAFDLHEAPRRGPGSRHQVYEEPDTLSSMVSSEARRRRKRERAPPADLSSRPWDQPHIIHPEIGDEFVVVTEKFVYRKKKQAEDEEERRKQEYIDRATMSPRETSALSSEEAANYYNGDWLRPELESAMPSIVGKPYQPYQSSKAKKGYRRDRHPDSELTESEASLEYSHAAQYSPPRSQLPQSPSLRASSNNWSGLNHTEWGDSPIAPSMTESEHARRQNRVSRSPTRNNPRRGRSTSNGHPAYVRDATSGGTEKTLIRTPRLSSGRIPDVYDDDSESSSSSVSRFMRKENRDDFDDYSVSNVLDAEREGENEARHVRFRETPSLRSAKDNWTSESRSRGQIQRSRAENEGSRRGGGSDWE